MKFIVFGLLFFTAVYARTFVNYDETVKDELKNNIDNLKTQAQDAIKKLMGEGKHAMADKIKILENSLVGVETQLEKLDPKTEIGKTALKMLENVVKGMENKLEEEIKVLSGTFYDETVKDELKTNIDNLKTQAQDAIKKLMGEGKHAMADKMKSLENYLVGLDTQLEKLNPQTELGKTMMHGMEALVKAAENKLEEEIKVLSGTFYAEDALRTEILKEVSDMYDEAKSGIESLAKTGKTELLDGLKKVIAFVQSMDTKIKALKPTTELGKDLVKLIEKLVSQGVTIMVNEVKKVQGTFYAVDADKEALLKTVGQILDHSKSAFEKLQKTDKPALVKGLKDAIAVGKEMETDLKTLHPTTTVGKTIFQGVEKLVKTVVSIITADLKTIDV